NGGVTSDRCGRRHHSPQPPPSQRTSYLPQLHARVRAKPAQHAATLNTTEAAAYSKPSPRFRCSKCTVSMENVENVVKPPNQPTPIKSRMSSWLGSSLAVSAPMARPPTTLTNNVPHGNPTPSVRAARTPTP